MGFDVHGTEGALSWSFQRLNELERYRHGSDPGYATVMASPEHPDFASFQPGVGNSMGFSDLKVIEAKRFLDSIRTGVAIAPSAADAHASARVIDAMVRSADGEGWAEVEEIAMPAVGRA